VKIRYPADSRQLRCEVNAEMKKQKYKVPVLLNQVIGDVVYAKCQCPTGAAAILFQMLDFCQLGLSEVPDEKTCAEELKQWHVPKKNPNLRVLFYLLTQEVSHPQLQISGQP
jgi:hypothetical protein